MPMNPNTSYYVFIPQSYVASTSQWQPKRQKTFGKYEVNVMKMEYSTSDCIVRLGCCKGVPVLIDAVLVILKTLHPLEDIEATFQPANVKLGGSCIADVSDVNEWKKLVYFFFPNILTTNSMTSLNFPHVSRRRNFTEH